MKKHLYFHTTFEESFVMQILEMIHTRLLCESFTDLFYFYEFFHFILMVDSLS